MLGARRHPRPDRQGERRPGHLQLATCMQPKTPNGTPVRDCIPSDEDSHTIGTVAFGPDGSLFVSSGDGSNYTDVDPRALRSQNLDSLSGKILRIDPMTGNGLPDNPFYKPADPGSNRSKVWARGSAQPVPAHREPGQRRARTSATSAGTTGRRSTPGKGANFGWPCYEGGNRRSGGQRERRHRERRTSSGIGRAQRQALRVRRCTTGAGDAVRAPVYTYNHTAGQGGATSGGAFYTGHAYPAQYRGAMFIADYNDRWIRYLTFDATGARRSPTSVPIRPSVPSSSSPGPTRTSTGCGTTTPAAKCAASVTSALATRPRLRRSRPRRRSASTPLTVEFNSDQSYDPDAQTAQLHVELRRRHDIDRPEPEPHLHPGRRVRRPPHDHGADVAVRHRDRPRFGSPSGAIRRSSHIEQPTSAQHVPGRRHHPLQRDRRRPAARRCRPSSMTWQLRNHHNQHVHFATLPSAADPGQPEPQPRFVRRGRSRRLGLLRGVRHGDGERGDHRQPVRHR